MNKILLFLLLLLIVPLVPSVVAVGVSPPLAEYIFKPNISDSLHFYFRNNQDRDITLLANLSGELAHYAKITSRDSGLVKPNEKMYVDIDFSLPESIGESGWHSFNVVATELEATGGTVGARGQVVVPIRFFVQYPGKKLSLKLEANDAGVGEDVNFKIFVSNLGTEPVEKAKVTVEIFKGSEKVGEVSSEEFAVGVLENVKKELFWNSGTNSPGVYNAKATLSYEAGNEYANDSFRIGTFDIEVKNYTKEVGKGIVNKFFIELESKWNRNIENIFANVDVLKDGKTMTSFSAAMPTLAPWERKNISSFLDASNLNEGTYELEIRLNFSSEGMTNSKTVKGQIEVVAAKKETAVEEKIEKKEEGFAISKYLTTVNLLIIIIIVLVVINIIILIRKRKNEKERDTYI